MIHDSRQDEGRGHPTGPPMYGWRKVESFAGLGVVRKPGRPRTPRAIEFCHPNMTNLLTQAETMDLMREVVAAAVTMGRTPRQAFMALGGYSIDHGIGRLLRGERRLRITTAARLRAGLERIK